MLSVTSVSRYHRGIGCDKESAGASGRETRPAGRLRGCRPSLCVCLSPGCVVYVSHQSVTAVARVPVSPLRLEQSRDTKIKQASVFYLRTPQTPPFFCNLQSCLTAIPNTPSPGEVLSIWEVASPRNLDLKKQWGSPSDKRESSLIFIADEQRTRGSFSVRCSCGSSSAARQRFGTFTHSNTLLLEL